MCSPSSRKAARKYDQESEFISKTAKRSYATVPYTEITTTLEAFLHDEPDVNEHDIPGEIHVWCKRFLVFCSFSTICLMC